MSKSRNPSQNATHRQEERERRLDRVRTRALAPLLESELPLNFARLGPRAGGLLGNKRDFTAALLIPLQEHYMIERGSLSVPNPKVQENLQDTAGHAPRVRKPDFRIAISPATFWRHTFGRRLTHGRTHRHPCPSCNQPTLRIFPDVDGELFFRCPPCGYCVASHDFLGRARGMNIDEARRWMVANGTYRTPPSDEWIAFDNARARLIGFFERNKYGMEHAAEAQRVKLATGEWGLFDRFAFLQATHGLIEPPQRPLQTYLVRCNRTVFGRPAQFDFFSENLERRFSIAVAPHRFLVTCGSWGIHLDWSDRAVVCFEENVAIHLQRCISKWPQNQRVPVLWVTECREPVAIDNAPFRSVLAVVTGEADLRQVAALAHVPGFRVRITSEEDIVEFRPESLVPNTELIPHLLDQLSRTTIDRSQVLTQFLQAPWLAPETEEALIVAAAREWNVLPTKLATLVESNEAPITIPLRVGHYFVANSRYYHEGDDPREVSNFAVYIVGFGEQCRLELRMGPLRAQFLIPRHFLSTTRRLYTAIQHAAYEAGMPPPLIYSSYDKRFLCSLINATRL